jgi:radical SAM protein with 4Fe4S-binding SPASM domain
MNEGFAYSDRVTVDCGRYLRADDPARAAYSYQHPFILELEITQRCNLRCVHCYAEASAARDLPELTLAQVCTILDQARGVGMRELSLTGGEVLLHPDFIAILDAGLERGFNLRFVTNASLLDDALLAAIQARPVKLITISLDAVDAATHEAIRGPGCHAATLAAIERLREAGQRLSIITAFSKRNLPAFDALFAYCCAHRFDWQVQMTSAKGRCTRGLTLDPAGFYALGERVAAAMASRPPINVIPMDDLAMPSRFAPLDRLQQTWQGRCTGGILNLFVRADGAVTPCSALAFPEYVVGNCFTEGLERICAEERCRATLAWLEPEALVGRCAACDRKQLCRGGCPEILATMCADRRENEYCFLRIEEDRILDQVLGP